MVLREAYRKSVREILSELKVRADTGLSASEAVRRRKRFGLNRIPEDRDYLLLRLFLYRFKDVLVLILVAAAIVSLAMKHIGDAIVIGIAIFLDAALSFIQVLRTERTLAALRKQVPDTVLVFRDGGLRSIAAEEIVVGDIIELRAGERVPADGRLIQTEGLKCQEAILTGEANDVEKSTAVLKTRTPVGDRRNMIFAGTTVVNGTGKAVIVAIGLNTHFGTIAQVLRKERSPDSPLRIKLQRLGLYLGWFVVGAVAILAVIGLLKGESLPDTARMAVTLVVSAIPEDLTMILTIALTVGVVRILRHKGVVRELSSGETLGATTVICADKTGTLTQGQMSVTSLNFMQGTVLLPDTRLGRDPWQLLALKGLALATSAHRLGKEAGEYFGSATERSALAFAESFGIDQVQLRREWRARDGIAFSSSWKYRAALVDHPTEAGQVLFVTGAPEILLERSSQALSSQGEIRTLTSTQRHALQRGIHAMALQGNRLLAIAVRRHLQQKEITHPDVRNLIFLGVLTIQDPVRKEVRQAIQQTAAAGVAVKLITGDYRGTAQAVARQVGLTANDDVVLEGSDMQGLSDEELSKRLREVTIVTRVEPLDKQRIIRLLQRQGHVVAMTGDGINDAVALKSADIGVAMGSGSDIAKESADLVLLDNSLNTIVAAIREGRVLRDNIRKVLAFLLSTNVAEVAIFFVTLLLGLPMPLLPAQILWINLVTDGTSDIALSLEPAERNVMQRQPEDPRAALLGRKLGGQIAYSGLILTIATVGLYWFLLRIQDQPLAYARTMAFSFLAVSALISVWSFRSLQESILRRGLTQNPWILLSSGASFLLQLLAVYVPVLQTFFQTVPLSAQDWLILTGLAVVAVGLIDMRKFFWPAQTLLSRQPHLLGSET